ncbi:hypothetical protein [Cellulomonas sp. RIT-PI-Y]|uniref:AMIN-like domain-containing (lipo)protein n=1 Tax=Cellulomonas sp. RIT-PI-Y TaxID=3035297 RepID=UPI0021D89BA8|nr:hypothetical protein [Cellulomonas sp. RIT-PI-Y]
MGAHRRISALRILAGTAAAMTLLAACATGESVPVASDASTAPVPTTTATETAAPSASPTAPAEDSAESDVPWDSPTDGVAASADAALTATDLRIGSQLGYDRIVVEFSGTGTPGWLSARSATAVEDPTGQSVDLESEGYLAVIASGLTTPPDGGIDPGTTTPGNSVVTGSEFTGVFEGEAQIWLGLADPEAPYRVFTLENPTRLVIDVQRSMA